MLIVKNWEEVEKITQQQASEHAEDATNFCAGKFMGYFVELAPYYGISLLIYDSKTKKQVLQELGIHYNHAGDKNKMMANEQKTASEKLFDIDFICQNPPKNWAEQRKRTDFVRNIYPKRYGYISSFYIGEPTEEQKQASEKGFFSYTNWGYFATEEQRNDVDKCTREVMEQYKNCINNFDFLKVAFVNEFYNFECMYSERYSEAVQAIGLDIKKLTATQQSAFDVAYKDFWRQVNEKGDY